MALLQTALLADKFTGLSCLLVIVWMIPNVVVEWGNPSSLEGTHLRISQGLPQRPAPSMLAPPEEWKQMYPPEQVSNVYMPTLKAFVTAASSSSSTDAALLDTIQTVATRIGEEHAEGDVVGCTSATAAVALGTWSLVDNHAQRRRHVVLGHGQTKELLSHAGLLDSAAKDASDSISILCVDKDETKEDGDLFYDLQALYSKVSVGGYIVLSGEHLAASSASIMELTANDEVFHGDNNILYWKKVGVVKEVAR